jgi:hypothetical protein
VQRYIDSAKKALIPFVIFVAFTLYLTYNSLSVPSIVIGDNFYWSHSTINDLLKPSILHESYLGDVSILSIFKGGFLYPLAALLSSANLPITLIYPFLFYLLSIVSFFLLTGEFLKNRPLRIIVALLYVFNPVIPYYYTSMLLAFAVVLLPLSLKYLIRALREIEGNSKQRISLNFLLSGLFLGLSISAHEQLFPSVLLVSLFFLAAFLVLSFKQYKISKKSRTFFFFVNAAVFLSVLLLINIPLVLSMQTAGQSHLSSYYTGRLNDFIDNVEYTYQNVRLDTLLRFGGDSPIFLGIFLSFL